MPKIVTTIIYEDGDIFDMPREQQIELIRQHLTLREIEQAVKTDLFPMERLLFKANAAIMFAETFDLFGSGL